MYKWKYLVRLLSRTAFFSLHKDPLWRKYSGKWEEVCEGTVALSFSSILLNRRLVLSSPAPITIK
jgi:hypothetical protein